MRGVTESLAPNNAACRTPSNKDVIYVANALAVELDKFLQIVGRGVGAARTTNLLLR